MPSGQQVDGHTAPWVGTTPWYQPTANEDIAPPAHQMPSGHIRHGLKVILLYCFLLARHGIHQSEQFLLRQAVGEVALAVGGEEFQLVTICNQLIARNGHAMFEDLPVIARILAVGKHGYNIHHRKQPSVGGIVPGGAHFSVIKEAD